MLKLYKNINNELHYWETWENNKNTSTIHWGIVGHAGETKTIKSSFLKDYTKKYKKKLVYVFKMVTRK